MVQTITREQTMNLPEIRKAEYFIVGLIALVFLGYAVQALRIGDTFRFTAVLIPSLVISLLPVAFEYATRLRLPPGVKSLVSLALLLHVAGGISRLYWTFAPFYDKVAHVVSALALFLVLISFFVVLDYLEKPVSWRRALIGSLVVTAIFMVAWEVSEYLIDVMAKTSYNMGIVDTILDLIANCIGILIGIGIVRYYRRIIPAGKNPGYLLTM